MSTFIVVTFDSGERAREAFEKVQQLHQAVLLNLTSAALIEIAKDGHLRLETTPHDPVAPLELTQAAAFGLMLGSILTTPQFGFATGGTLGAVMAKHEQRDDSVDQKFRDHLSKALRPGHWAVAVYATEVANDEVSRQLEPIGGTLFSLDLTAEDEAALAEAVGVEG